MNLFTGSHFYFPLLFVKMQSEFEIPQRSLYFNVSTMQRSVMFMKNYPTLLIIILTVFNMVFSLFDKQCFRCKPFLQTANSFS